MFGIKGVSLFDVVLFAVMALPFALEWWHRRSWLARIGFPIAVLGSAPFFYYVATANDPSPNPVGAGILAGFSIVIGGILIIAGTVRAFARRR